jgi:hypothetical protein
MTTKINKAAGYLAAYIRSNGRFDLGDLADRAGVSDELAFVTSDLLEVLEDDIYLLDLEEAYQEAKQEQKAGPVSDWLKELTDRYFG